LDQQGYRSQIDKMLSEIDMDMLAYIISALYFKGTWTEEFDIEKTVSVPFASEDGRRWTML